MTTHMWAPALVLMQGAVAIPPPSLAPVVAEAPTKPAAKIIVEIEIADEISSKINIIGDTFAIKLVAPLIVDGRTILPAGLAGRGEVTHAAKRGSGGKAGELIVNARYLQCGDVRVPLGHFHYSIAGKNNVGEAFATAQVIPFGQFLVSGHDAVIPAGSRGTAQVGGDGAILAQLKPGC